MVDRKSVILSCIALSLSLLKKGASNNLIFEAQNLS